MAIGTHLTHSIDRHVRLTALVNALLLGSIDASPLALQDEATLHLCHHAQHGHQNAVGIGRGAELRFEHPQAGALLFEFVDKVEHVPSRPPQSIELDHVEFIAGANEFEDRSQLITTGPPLAAHLPGADGRRPWSAASGAIHLRVSSGPMGWRAPPLRGTSPWARAACPHGATKGS
jgi:hypothetical protein